MKLVCNLMAFLYGIVIGSFLNVCIYRIPKKEDIVKKRSHCMQCGHTLHWYELIPVLSFLLQKGKCKVCGAKLSWQYPVVELLNGIIYLIVISKVGITLYGILLCILYSVLIVISIIDFRTYTIPIGLNKGCFLIGVIYSILDYSNLFDHLLGMVCVSGFLFVLYFLTKKQGIGDGDIKLMIGAGAFLGLWPSLLALWIACVLGAIIHCIRMKVSKVGHRLAFGPYLSVGIVISALYGKELIQLYVDTFFKL